MMSTHKAKKPNLRKNLLPYQKRFLPALIWLYGGRTLKPIPNPYMAKHDPNYAERIKALPNSQRYNSFGSGRTHLLAIAFIEIALQFPMEWIHIQDHSVGLESREHLERIIMCICRENGIGFTINHMRQSIRCWIPNY